MTCHILLTSDTSSPIPPVPCWLTGNDERGYRAGSNSVWHSRERVRDGRVVAAGPVSAGRHAERKRPPGCDRLQVLCAVPIYAR